LNLLLLPVADSHSADVQDPGIAAHRETADLQS
jgi:hypothetical protein